MISPTPRMTAAYETFARLQNAKAVAAELGITDSAVYAHVRNYIQITGAPYPPGYTPRGAFTALAAAERQGAIEKDVAEIKETLGKILTIVERIEGRAPILLVEHSLKHRRQADGGEGGKRERRLAGRMIG